MLETASPSDLESPFGRGAPAAGDWSCPVCATAIAHEFRAGRKRVYCSNACRQKAYRWRRDNGVRLLVTPWTPARRSANRRMHAVRPAQDFVATPQDQFGRNVAVCGVFAHVPNPAAVWHDEFVPGSRSACAACTALIGADPAWHDEYPVVGLDERGYPTVYRPPELRRADYLSRHPGSLAAA